MTSSCNDYDKRIFDALDAYEHGHLRSLSAAAIAYQIQPRTLQQRVKNLFHDSRGGHNKLLTSGQESALCEWLERIIQLGFPPRLDLIRSRANLLLVDPSQSSSPTVGTNWPFNFLKRHKDFRLRNSIQFDAARAACTTRKKIEGWYRRFKNIQEEYGVVDNDIYNVNETGFLSGSSQRCQVVTLATQPTKSRRVVQPGQQVWITSIECINASGNFLPPLLILPGQLHQTVWYRTNMPLDWHVGVSATGWTNNNLALEWVRKVFEPYSQLQRVGEYRMLVIDGHGSHITTEFILFCWDHKILPVCLSPHTSHILQPLDVSCFGPLKHYHSQAVMDSAQTGTINYDKVEFLENFPAIRRRAFNSNNILSAFRSTGLVPFNPDIVLSKYPISSRTTTPPPLIIQPQRTPKTVRQVQGCLHNILEELKEENLEEIGRDNIRLQVLQLAKTTEVAMSSRANLEKEVAELRAANQKRVVQSTFRRTILQNGGLLSQEQALDMIEEKEAREKEEAEKQAQRAQKKAKRSHVAYNPTEGLGECFF